MRIGIIGSRKRNTQEDKEILINTFKKVIQIFSNQEIIIVSGGCNKGADKFAEEIAKEMNLKIEIYYPEIKKNCTKHEYTMACYKRNIEIAKKSDELIAIVSPERKGGTEHTIKQFIKMKNKNPWIIY